MRVVFLEDVPQVARAGEVKDVADGYGRNYLIPRKLARPATAAMLREIEEHHRALDRRAAKIEAEAEQLAKQLDGMNITITAKVGAQGRLYGAVTNTHVADEIRRVLGRPIDRRKVMLRDPIRALGTYPVEVHLAGAHTATVNVTVAAEA